jgi:hypothetical protein
LIPVLTLILGCLLRGLREKWQENKRVNTLKSYVEFWGEKIQEYAEYQSQLNREFVHQVGQLESIDGLNFNIYDLQIEEILNLNKKDLFNTFIYRTTKYPKKKEVYFKFFE